MNPLPFELTLDTWMVSDSHFGHANMCKPDFGGRPDDHDWIMRERWQETVGRRDTVLHLGDLTYRGKPEYLNQVMHGLPGDKYLLRGNHDKQTAAFYARYGFTFLKDLLLEEFTTPEGRTIRHTGFYWHDPDGRRILFSHYPDQRRLDWTVNVHGHIHGNGYPPGCDETRDYRNISVEVVDYRPVRLRDVLYGEDGVHYLSRRAAGVHEYECRRPHQQSGKAR